MKGFEQVERDVRFELVVRLTDDGQIVLHPERVHVVLEILAQRLEHVVLGLPLGGREIMAADVVGRHLVVVHQDEHAEFSHRPP